MPKAEAITELMLIAPSTWLTRSPEGQRFIDTLYAQLERAGLLAPSAAGDDVARLHAIFDVALQEGCGEVVTDWIIEVCGDPSAASADPLEAHLMDGCCVQQWAQRTLLQCQARLMQALQQGLAAEAACEVVHAEAGRLHALLHIFQALSNGGDCKDLPQARCLAMAADVAAWATRGLPVSTTRWGVRYGSAAEWRAVVNRRRDAAAPSLLLIHSLLQQLRQQGCTPPSYPFASLEESISLFLTGSPDHVVQRARLACFVYALTDAGFTFEADTLRSAFDVKAGEVSAWVAACWLDQACCGPTAPEALTAACRAVPSGLTAYWLGFEAVEALERAGAPDVALIAARCRRQAGSNNGVNNVSCGASLAEAKTLIRARLANGLITEATIEAARFLQSPACSDASAAATALGEHLAGWAAASRQLPSLAMLPLPGRLEAAIVKWFSTAIAEGQPGSSQLPLFLLQRNQLAEADAASSAVDDALAAGVLQEAEGETQRRHTVIAASRQLLPGGLTPALGLMQLSFSRGPSQEGGPSQHVAVESSPPDTMDEQRDDVIGEQPDSSPVRQTEAQSQGQDDEQLPMATPTREHQGEGDTPTKDSPASQPTRTMRREEFSKVMGVQTATPARSTGPRTRQMSKRQRLQAQQG